MVMLTPMVTKENLPMYQETPVIPMHQKKMNKRKATRLMVVMIMYRQTIQLDQFNQLEDHLQLVLQNQQ